MADALRFDDIAALRALARDDFGPPGPPLAITQEMIASFADLTGDRQWIHVDVERARRDSPYHGTIAHGFLVLSLLSSLAAGDDVRVTGSGSVINYGADRLRFVSPVPAGSSVHVRRRLIDATAKAGGTLVTRESEIRVVGSERPAVLYRHLTLYLP